MNKPLTLVGIGCGGRTRTYCELAAQQPHRYRIVAGADPDAERVEQVRTTSRNPEFRSFANAEACFAAGRLGDVAIIGTQDAYHVEPALRALELGYDLLLEKPVAPHPADVLRIRDTAQRLGRRVLVCHVLRYSPFYVQVKALVASGVLGDIVSIDAREGVGDFHQAHSYVRGHWAKTANSTSMIIAKSCHDMDIMSWLVDRPCERVSSFGSLQHFTAAHRPAGAPARCTDGCPHATTCNYDAMRYAGRHRAWLSYVWNRGLSASQDEVREWLATSPWGRCVYACDNDAVDHQVMSLEFAGGITGTFTMTAFDSGRNLTICGTKGVLRGGESMRHLTGGKDIVVSGHDGGHTYHEINYASGGYGGHMGADPGLIDALATELAKPDPTTMRTGIDASVQSHLMGFAAEYSRQHGGEVVNLADYARDLKSQ